MLQAMELHALPLARVRAYRIDDRRRLPDGDAEQLRTYRHKCLQPLSARRGHLQCSN
jgi:hypothetical protein